MFASEHFLQLHVPKTGGTWLRDVLQYSDGRAPQALQCGSHKPARFAAGRGILPGRRVVVATVRHPATWYPSAYAHLRNSNSPEAVRALMAWGGGSVTWEAVLWGWTHPKQVSGVGWREWGGFVQDWSPQEAREARASGLGWASCWYRRQYLVDGVRAWDRVVVTTRLEDAVQAWGLDVLPACNRAEDRMAQAERAGLPPTEKPSLTQEQRAWVEEADAELIALVDRLDVEERPWG